MRKAINDGRVIEPKKSAKSAASDKSTPSKEDASMEMGTACARPDERVLSEADILPDTDNKILNVCIDHTAEARHNRAIEHLVQYLNDADYKYPGTKLTMRFSLGAPELPAPGG